MDTIGDNNRLVNLRKARLLRFRLFSGIVPGWVMELAAIGYWLRNVIGQACSMEMQLMDVFRRDCAHCGINISAWNRRSIQDNGCLKNTVAQRTRCRGFGGLPTKQH